MNFTVEQLEPVLTNFEVVDGEITELVALCSQSQLFMGFLFGICMREKTEPAKTASDITVGMALGYRLAVEATLAKVAE